MEIEIVCLLKPLFYSRYLDGIYNRRKKDEIDSFSVFHTLNNYHENIKLQ